MQRIAMLTTALLLVVGLAWMSSSEARLKSPSSASAACDDENLPREASFRPRSVASFAMAEVSPVAPGGCRGASLETADAATAMPNSARENPAPVAAAPPGPVAEKGLAYLANQQLTSGGWGQGGGWRTAAQGGRIQSGHQGYQDAADVANTAIATLALIRGGSTPTSGPYAEQVRAGINFVLASIESSDDESLFVTEVRGTQLQSKIGVYVDTFLANLLLAEVRGQMAGPGAEARLEAGLARVVAKIEQHQRDDGTFAANQGWASVLSTSIANKALTRSRQAGAAVSDEALEKIARQASEGYDEARGDFRDGDSYGTSAGVKLYKDGAGLAALDDLSKTDSKEALEARRVLASEASAEEKRRASSKLERLEQTKQKKERALSTMAAQLSDRAFVAGFGSSGGEEYLSYMNISEALATQGGEPWEEWNGRVSDSLAEAQNGDGSWSGHHCITGRTFVTASALLTLMADRAPRPLAAEVQG
ncbi:MAG: hypothetical protein AAF657_28370 [Acidobacteriota bacterium]